MIFNTVIKGGGGGDDTFHFVYTGDYTDNRDENGVGTVRFNTSGTLKVTSGTALVSAYILAGGGGGVRWTQIYGCASGGGGGNQTVTVELTEGMYEITVGAGGAGRLVQGQSGAGYDGGDTIAFGYTSTGGGGGRSYNAGGLAGSPNATAGTADSNTAACAGGSPNGGSAKFNSYANAGGDGYVEITFPEEA